MKEETIYMGGERDKQRAIMPLHFEKFFKQNFLIFVLIILIILLIFLKFQF